MCSALGDIIECLGGDIMDVLGDIMRALGNVWVDLCGGYHDL